MRSQQYDEHAVTELKLFVENDAELYHRRAKPIMDNLLRKIKRGVYDSKLAVKGWQYLADDGAKKYDKEFAGGAHSFSVADRKEVARRLAREYEAELKTQKVL